MQICFCMFSSMGNVVIHWHYHPPPCVLQERKHAVFGHQSIELAPVTKHTVNDDELEGPRRRHLSLFRRGEALKAANGMFGNELSSSTAIATTPAEAQKKKAPFIYCVVALLTDND